MTPDREALESQLAEAFEKQSTQMLESLLLQVQSCPTDDQAAIDSRIAQRLKDPRVGAGILNSISLSSLAELVQRAISRLADFSESSAGHDDDRRSAWELLDVFRQSDFLLRVEKDGSQTAWARRILELIDASHFTFPHLLEQRTTTYGQRPLFLIPRGGRALPLSYAQAQGRIDLIAKGLLSLLSEAPEKRVAILSQNLPEYALVDLACLATGIVNVMIPATASVDDVAYILRHSNVGIVFVSDDRGLGHILAAGEGLDAQPQIVTLERTLPGRSRGLTFEQLLDKGARLPDTLLPERRAALRIDDLATIMYTSGTTGIPKGISFSHRNIVFKRFARAIALPEIGPSDRFLCYLPLFHTFGRFLEMTGALFWGATYCFAEDASITTLIDQMKRLQPSVFISIPRKWIQLFDAINQHVDIDTASHDAIRAQVDSATGGNLRWGLSAAGYLDPQIFRFFNSNGVSLMSGFGMTEATGGITMTPPGRYKENSLGAPLPGIETTLAEDGELLVRGPYVMIGYLDPPDNKPSFDEEGWLATGDIMEQDSDGFYRIVDRKKEIYKNVKGQTIAPQKIENLFRDFESVGRVFLVGDHRDFNTALIYPNPDYEGIDFEILEPEELKEHFRSVVVSVNSFLEPFESIVDFAIIERDFDLDKGELTPKGTFRRATIERSFSDQIGLLYRRSSLSVGGAEITFPNWLFQALGITTHDLEIQDAGVRLAATDKFLSIRNEHDSRILIGSCHYRTELPRLDLGLLLVTPGLWLGNEELVDFTQPAPVRRTRRRRNVDQYSWDGRPSHSHPIREQLVLTRELANGAETSLENLHAAAVLLEAQDTGYAREAVDALEQVIVNTDGEHADLARRLLRRQARNPLPEVVSRSLKVLIGNEHSGHYRQTLRTFLSSPACNIVDEAVSELFTDSVSPEQLEAIIAETGALSQRAEAASQDENIAERFLSMLVGYGTDHPSHYKRLRSFFNRMSLKAGSEELRDHAERSTTILAEGFRSWLGTPARVAVDPETGHEYGWKDVIEFNEDVAPEARTRLLEAISETPILAEGVFLFGDRTNLHLSDLPPGGVWIRRLGTAHGKTVFRVSIRTRFREEVDLALNLAESLSEEEMDEETRWLIVCSDPRTGWPLVEEFGGYYRDRGMWTEEYIPGEPLDRAIRTFARRADEQETLSMLWPAAAWSAAAAYIDFWDRTGRQLAIADPTPANVIAPMHDYQSGARIISIAHRTRCTKLETLLGSLRRFLIGTIESQHETLKDLVSWRILFSAVLDAVGEQDGLELLKQLAANDSATSSSADQTQVDELRTFIDEVERRGFLSRRLHFAIQRFRRWRFLNQDATLAARAATLKELGRTYGLSDPTPEHPETRVRFFRDTVFQNATGELAEGLEELIRSLRRRDIELEEIPQAIADLRAKIQLDRDQDFFLARLTYPYLQPEDDVTFIARDVGSERQSEMVVGCQDPEGYRYFIRHALTAREIGRLYDLFVAAKLKVQFRVEHRFLVAVNDRGTVIGGLFYEVEPEEQLAHMDKIVVDSRFMGRGIARSLMDELCHRLVAQGFKSLTTGFFRPQFFYHFGFVVERRYAGLVRSLGESSENEPAP